jgi:hypothetical protein
VDRRGVQVVGQQESVGEVGGKVGDGGGEGNGGLRKGQNVLFLPFLPYPLRLDLLFQTIIHSCARPRPWFCKSLCIAGFLPLKPFCLPPMPRVRRYASFVALTRLPRCYGSPGLAYNPESTEPLDRLSLLLLLALASSHSPILLQRLHESNGQSCKPLSAAPHPLAS